MKTAIVKHSIVLNGHKTSISLEADFFDALKEVSSLQDKSVSGVVAEIDNQRQVGNLSSAIRLFVLSYYQSQGGHQ